MPILTDLAAVQRSSQWRSGKVVETATETPRARTLTVQVPAWKGHRLGQHVNVRLKADDGTWAERSYSITSPPEDTLLTLLVGKADNGGASHHLINVLQEGDEMELRGPLGDNTWEVGPHEPLLLVAGGCGIAPLLAVIRHRVAVENGMPIRLMYSARSYEEIAYKSQLDRLAAVDESFEVTYTLTRSWPSDWAGHRRRIDKEMIDEVAWPAEQNPLAFVCGPTSLVRAVASRLATLGYEPDRIRT
jgi:ferredoxin-NADP reductase